MRIIISPAKKMNRDTDHFDCRDLPVFLKESEGLLRRLREMTEGELKRLWKCNDQIAQLNIQRLAHMDLGKNLTPAIMAYEGIQYQYMAPGVFTGEELEYVQQHLRILSGFYGVLRPFDGVTPYRLEMQAKLSICNTKNLYSYWGNKIASNLFAQTDCVLNLASKEYSLCVSKYLKPEIRFVTCIFGERIHGKITEKGTMCKMARGEMVRFMAERKINRVEEIQAFSRLGYRFAPEESHEETYVFLKESGAAE